MGDFMNFKPHTEKLGFFACLGHVKNTPVEWCHKINECQRNFVLRHHQISEDEFVAECLCDTDKFEEFME
jgi:hypothetical protein